MGFARYEPATSCRSAGPGAMNLMYWLDRESPWALTLGNLGVANCRLPSIHSEWRAGDSAVPVAPGGHMVGHALVDFLTRNAAALGIMETIFARMRRSAAHPNGKRYTGPSPHLDHVHWALSRHACRHLNVPTIRAIAAGSVGRPFPSPPAAPPPAGPPAVDLKALAGAIQMCKVGAVLRLGVNNPNCTKFAQAGINRISGRGLVVDGDFGPATHQAVLDLQRWFGLPADGVIGPLTWRLLYP